jgi:hypothetical protein
VALAVRSGLVRTRRFRTQTTGATSSSGRGGSAKEVESGLHEDRRRWAPEGMDERKRPTTNQPLNAPGPRPRLTPLLAVLAVVLFVLIVFAVITWLRYTT